MFKNHPTNIEAHVLPHQTWWTYLPEFLQHSLSSNIMNMMVVFDDISILRQQKTATKIINAQFPEHLAWSRSSATIFYIIVFHFYISCMSLFFPVGCRGPRFVTIVSVRPALKITEMRNCRTTKLVKSQQNKLQLYEHLCEKQHVTHNTKIAKS